MSNSISVIVVYKICHSFNVHNRKDAEVDAEVQYLVPPSFQKTTFCIVALNMVLFQSQAMFQAMRNVWKTVPSLTTHFCGWGLCFLFSSRLSFKLLFLTQCWPAAPSTGTPCWHPSDAKLCSRFICNKRARDAGLKLGMTTSFLVGIVSDYSHPLFSIIMWFQHIQNNCITSFG